MFGCLDVRRIPVDFDLSARLPIEKTIVCLPLAFFKKCLRFESFGSVCDVGALAGSALTDVRRGHQSVSVPRYSFSRSTGALLHPAFVQKIGFETRCQQLVVGKNPVVLARYRGRERSSGSKRRCRKVVVYGHYDVQPANEQGWLSPPFELTGRNGYLYGRGVTDNKGPILIMYVFFLKWVILALF